MRKSKFLPQLSEYLHRRVVDPTLDAFREQGIRGAMVGMAVGLSGSAAFWFTQHPNPWIAAAVGGVGTMFAMITGGGIAEYNAKEKFLQGHPRAAKSQEVHGRLKKYLEEGKLHRHLEPAIAALLEECARSWCRIDATLSGPIWTMNDLSTHWETLRQNLRLASNEAMDNVLFLLEPSFRHQPKSESWETHFRGFLADVLGLVSIEDQGPFPNEFEPARLLAQKLVDLANQVESATAKLSQQKPSYASAGAKSIDDCLAELRQLEEAETELHQSLHE